MPGQHGRASMDRHRTRMNAEPPLAAASDLAALRAEIDQLDDSIHGLVMRRAAIVQQLADRRIKGSGPPVRPGREAIILRRLLARHTGPFPRAALVQVWRALINGHTAMQGPFVIAVYNTAPGSGFVSLTREHFGTATPARSLTTPAQVLAAVSAGEAALGVLPMPGTEDEAAIWWTALLARDTPRVHIVTRLPFWTPRTEGAPRVEALVVGVMPPEPTGADRSLLVCETRGELSRARIVAALEAAGLPPGGLLLRAPGSAALLIEVDAACADDDPRLEDFAARADTTRPVLAGAYPVPIDAATPPVSGAAPA